MKPPRSPVSFASFASFVAVVLGGAAARADEEVPVEAPAAPAPEDAPNVEPPPPVRAPEPEPESEGRRLVGLYNRGFQWNLSPGVVFASGKAGLALGVRLGYGIDTGPVIVVPGVKLTGIFLDPNVYVGLPVLKLVVPIDRVAPFIEGGVGVGHVGGEVAKTGAALQGGGGLVIHVSPAFAFGAEAGYQVITGTGFQGFTVGPILAIGL